VTLRHRGLLGPKALSVHQTGSTPIYYLQLLAFAQGVPYDELGLERQRFKVECLKRFETEDDEAPTASEEQASA
jgi:hypothetical protein